MSKVRAAIKLVKWVTSSGKTKMVTPAQKAGYQSAAKKLSKNGGPKKSGTKQSSIQSPSNLVALKNRVTKAELAYQRAPKRPKGPDAARRADRAQRELSDARHALQMSKKMR